jgi:quercetin dioxygenase-like cupin family protein
MPTARSDDRSDDFRPATAYPLGELAAVAPGAIVSRTLVRSGGGTVTLFAFDEGQSLSEHTTPFDALVHVVDGALELTIGGEAVHAAAGQIVLMPANVPHGLAAVRPSRMLLVMLRDRGAGA